MGRRPRKPVWDLRGFDPVGHYPTGDRTLALSYQARPDVWLHAGQHFGCRVNGLVNDGFVVQCAKEESFELAARHINATSNQAPEVLSKCFTVRSIRVRPVVDGRVVEEQRQHAANVLHLEGTSTGFGRLGQSRCQSITDGIELFVRWVVCK